MFRRLDDAISVYGQLLPADVAEAKAQGFTTLVNNRPDGEEAGQPEGGTIREAAEAAGLDYHAIPIGHGGFSEASVAAMAQVLGEAEGPVLAFCRSGTRSTLLWALARSTMGDSGADLAEKAAGAGYDLGPIRGHIG
ncbi:TIGR01244 family sulfur transferase [Sphingomonas naphthae]|uniref:TIGR01244 family sulfur transferase n=1 Tax=Sphingomonas naphthae TaxID=1813468 RepID=A0ABY7TJ89_9SPHN|nr:TIGR01244 family sulfur transferase [Sphingomonas naphthae]WCT73293.1 TIGR01244 family sulfur transferase [Sphingomonas naphthae]